MTVEEALKKYDVSMGSRGLRLMAQENLLPDEDVMFAHTVLCVKEDGKFGALLVVTDSRVICCTRKLIARELVEFPYLNIHSMEIKGKAFDKELHIKSLTETIVLAGTLKELNLIKGVLQTLIEYDTRARPEQVTDSTAVQGSAKVDEDMENQIRTLKRLLEDDLITPEEYEIKRRQILDL